MVDLVATILVWGAVLWVTAPLWILGGLAVVVSLTSGGE